MRTNNLLSIGEMISNMYMNSYDILKALLFEVCSYVQRIVSKVSVLMYTKGMI